MTATDGMRRVLTPEALEAAAEKALTYRTGARGLRTLIEEILLDVMYEIPSRGDVRGTVFRIGHLGHLNELELMGGLAGIAPAVFVIGYLLLLAQQKGLK